MLLALAVSTPGAEPGCDRDRHSQRENGRGYSCDPCCYKHSRIIPVRSGNAVACARLEDGTPIAVTGGGYPGYAGEVIVWDLRAGRMQAAFAAPYPVDAPYFDSDSGVAIGAATEIVRLKYGP